MSNQGGIRLKPDPKSLKSDSKRLDEFKAKLAAVFGQLDIPTAVYAATGQDKFRKPRTGMWEQMRVDYGLEDVRLVDMESCFYIGDAGGRPAEVGGGPRDHACSDR